MHACTLRVCGLLQVLDRLSNESSQLLDVLGHTLHELTGLTAPIHSRATALTQAQRNIAAANAAVDELLDNLDTSRRVSRGAARRAGHDAVHTWQQQGAVTAAAVMVQAQVPAASGRTGGAAS
jgi:hypothetical protein